MRLRLRGCQDLPNRAHAALPDPHVVIDVNGRFEFRTITSYQTLNPVWEQEFLLTNVPSCGCNLWFKVVDKHFGCSNVLCNARWSFAAVGAAGMPQEHLVPLHRPGAPPSGLHGTTGRPAGTLAIQVLWWPIAGGGEIEFRGPARYRRSLSALPGGLIGSTTGEWRKYACYKVSLFGFERFFPHGEAQHWNQDYDAAVQIFKPASLVGAAARAQHAMLYAADRGRRVEFGELRGWADWQQLLWDGQPRYYTYVLMRDGLRFSETGAAFFTDMFSKHAMHSSCARFVAAAGEFLMLADRTFWDNNSGTYAPPAPVLHQLGSLLRHCFPDMPLETVCADDPRLSELHALAPSRVKTPAVQAVVA